jgi:hypothetical protein
LGHWQASAHVSSFLAHALNPLDQDRPKHGQDGCKQKEHRVAVKRIHHESGNGDPLCRLLVQTTSTGI